MATNSQPELKHLERCAIFLSRDRTCDCGADPAPQDAPPRGYYEQTVGSILNAYREGDLLFDEAITALGNVRADLATTPVDRYALGDVIRRAFLKHGHDAWCSIADDVIAEFVAPVGDGEISEAVLSQMAADAKRQSNVLLAARNAIQNLPQDALGRSSEPDGYYYRDELVASLQNVLDQEPFVTRRDK